MILLYLGGLFLVNASQVYERNNQLRTFQKRFYISNGLEVDIEVIKKNIEFNLLYIRDDLGYITDEDPTERPYSSNSDSEEEEDELMEIEEDQPDFAEQGIDEAFEDDFSNNEGIQGMDADSDKTITSDICNSNSSVDIEEEFAYINCDPKVKTLELYNKVMTTKEINPFQFTVSIDFEIDKQTISPNRTKSTCFIVEIILNYNENITYIYLSDPYAYQDVNIDINSKISLVRTSFLRAYHLFRCILRKYYNRTYKDRNELIDKLRSTCAQLEPLVYDSNVLFNANIPLKILKNKTLAVTFISKLIYYLNKEPACNVYTLFIPFEKLFLHFFPDMIRYEDIILDIFQDVSNLMLYVISGGKDKMYDFDFDKKYEETANIMDIGIYNRGQCL